LEESGSTGLSPGFRSFLLLATLAKILVFDFEFLGEYGRIIVLFILGGFLIAFSFLYQRFRKAVMERKLSKPAENSQH
jgi:type II secretory pathway component PulF